MIIPQTQTLVPDNPVLVTQAEFQLFLDNSGRRRELYTPDHWPVGQPAADQEQKPVLGVSFDAARAYCDWCSKHDPQAHFRLPHATEMNEQSGTCWLDDGRLHDPQPIELSFGQWIAPGDGTVGTEYLAALPIRVSAYKPGQTWFSCPDDLRWGLFASALNQPRARVFEYALVLERNFENDNAPKLIRSVARDLASTLDPSFDTIRIRGRPTLHNLVRVLFSPPGQGTRELIRSLVHDVSHRLDHALAGIHELNLNSIRAQTLAHELADFRTLERGFDLAHELTYLCDQGPAGTPLNDLVDLFRQVVNLLVGFIFLVDEGFVYQTDFVPILRVAGALDDFRIALLDEINQLDATQPGRSKPLKWDEWKGKLDQLLQLYAILAILERRRRGEWQAIEGLRVVRER